MLPGWTAKHKSSSKMQVTLSLLPSPNNFDRHEVQSLDLRWQHFLNFPTHPPTLTHSLTHPPTYTHSLILIHDEPPHLDLCCLQSLLQSKPVLRDLCWRQTKIDCLKQVVSYDRFICTVFWFNRPKKGDFYRLVTCQPYCIQNRNSECNKVNRETP